MGIIVRSATEGDVSWVVDELRAFSNSQRTKLKPFPGDQEAKAAITRMIQDHLFLVAVRGEERLGFLAAYVFAHPFNAAIRTLSESYWWVAEKFRGTRAGAMLLNAYLEHGKKHADWVFMTLQSNSPVNPDSLIKRGFRIHETYFLMEVS